MRNSFRHIRKGVALILFTLLFSHTNGQALKLDTLCNFQNKKISALLDKLNRTISDLTPIRQYTGDVTGFILRLSDSSYLEISNKFENKNKYSRNKTLGTADYKNWKIKCLFYLEKGVIKNYCGCEELVKTRTEHDNS